jgi:dynein heavy chain
MTLLRQHLDYYHWYDRVAMTIKEVKIVNYVAGMNPISGSFTISSRLQRHFSTIAMGIISDTSFKMIMSNMFDIIILNIINSLNQLKKLVRRS